MKRVPLTLLFILLNTFVFSQKAVRIEYTLDYKLDSTNLNKSDRELMILDILPEENQSFFRAETMYRKDSILQSQNPHALLGVSKPKFLYTILKNHNNGSITSYEDYSSYKFKVEDKFSLQWQVDNNQTKEILGQKCKLATTEFRGRKYEAWFAIDLPFSDGPYKFSGLPGTILELYDTRKNYRFQAIQIKNIEKYKSYINSSSYKGISRKEFAKFLQNIKDKPSLMIRNENIKLSDEAYEQYDRKRRERTKNENNPIELKDN